MKRNRIILYTIALLQGMVFYAPIATLYRAAQGVTVFEITVIESVSLGLCLVLEIPWGFVADRIGYKKTFLFCCMLFLVSKIVFWKADGFGMFLLERVMLSVILAGLSGVDMSLLYLSCEAGQSQRAFGIYSGLETLGLLVAAAVYSLFIGENYSLAGFLTVLSYGLAAIAALGLKEVRKKAPEVFRAREVAALVQSTLKDRRLMIFLLTVVLFTETHYLVTTFLNQLQYERSGMTAAAMGYVYIVVTVAGLSGMFSDRFTGRWGIRRTGVLLFAAAIAATFVLALTKSAAVSVLGIVLVRISFNIFQPLQRELQNRQVHTENRATALSVNAMIIDCMSIGINVAFGALAEWSLPAAFIFGALICTAGLFLFLLFCRSRTKKTA